MPTTEALDLRNVHAKRAVFKALRRSPNRCMRRAHRMTRANCTADDVGNRHANGHTGATAQSRNGRDIAPFNRHRGGVR